MKQPLVNYLLRCYQQLRLVCCLWLAQQAQRYSIARCKLFFILWLTIIGLWSMYKILYSSSSSSEILNHWEVKQKGRKEILNMKRLESSVDRNKRIHDENKR